MPQYKAPLHDIRFLLNEVFDAEDHYRKTGFADATPDVVDAVLQEAAKFCETILSPLNRSGDEVGARWHDGAVTTPPGFKDAHDAYVEGQWGSVAANPEFGGQGLPESLELIFNEMAVTANLSWRHCSGLTLGAIHALDAHASDELKQRYLPKMIELTWSGTMCLTEPHAGSDVGIISSKATPRADGSYGIEGTKIFITYGEHDLTENIVHLVLARLPDAPDGPKGISLFVVPKLLPDADGNPGERNGVHCASIEKKMGIKGSPTAVLNFEDAQGWMVGKPNAGLSAMFTMMNYARIDVAMHGLGQAELSFQGAAQYARERLQMRAPTGPAAPDKRADPIIVHPDVRRMLLTLKAITEGGRALAYYSAMQLDGLHSDDEQIRADSDAMLAFLIPITKGFLTEAGQETTMLGMQVFGGHGFVRETGMEQMVRDCRISTIYEGTSAIQANDLLRRKVLGSKGALLDAFIAKIETLVAECESDETLGSFCRALSDAAGEWKSLTEEIARHAADRNGPAAAAFDYMMFSGYTVVGYFWLRMAQVASAKLKAGEGEERFYRTKIQTARFYFERLLPRTRGLAASIRSGAGNLMEVEEDCFVF